MRIDYVILIPMIGQSGDTPLHLAAAYDHCKTAEILIAAGADLDAQNMVTAPCAFLLLITIVDDRV